MEVSASVFYAWVKRLGETDRIRKKAALEGKVGIKPGYYQVRHLLAQLGLKARYPKRFKVTTNSNHNEVISRLFEHLKAGSTLRLSLIFFQASRGLGNCRPHADSIVCESATNGLLAKKAGTWLAPSLGSGQPICPLWIPWTPVYHENGQSMNLKGNCWDNSPTERFFRSLKYEQLNYEKFRTKE